MMWHGWDDQLIFPRGTIDYFQRVQAAAGGEEATSKFAKLFMARRHALSRWCWTG